MPNTKAFLSFSLPILGSLWDSHETLRLGGKIASNNFLHFLGKWRLCKGSITIAWKKTKETSGAFTFHIYSLQFLSTSTIDGFQLFFHLVTISRQEKSEAIHMMWHMIDYELENEGHDVLRSEKKLFAKTSLLSILNVTAKNIPRAWWAFLLLFQVLFTLKEGELSEKLVIIELLFPLKSHLTNFSVFHFVSYLMSS